MSFCPSKDIHSVYLDNELPQAYTKKYEELLRRYEQANVEYGKLKDDNRFKI